MKLLLIVLLSIILNSSMLFAQSAKVVYDLTTGKSSKIDKGLINSIKAMAKYYKEEKQELQIIVVISGDAYKYFIEDLKNSPYFMEDDVLDVQKALKPRLEYLSDAYGVTFNMCATGMSSRGIDKETLYKYVHADLMKSVYLIDAQNDGYAYMPIH